MWAMRAALDPVAGAQVEAALRAYASRRWRDQQHCSAATETSAHHQLMADAPVDLTAAGGGGKGHRLTPIVVIDHQRLTDGDPTGRCQLIDGTPVPPTTADRAIYDNGLRTAVTGPAGAILHLSRRTRLASADQRTALQLRDGGCVWPQCDTGPDWCHAHHLESWAHGGRTDLDNLALVCTKHHHMVHEGGWTLGRGGDGGWLTRRPE